MAVTRITDLERGIFDAPEMLAQVCDKRARRYRIQPADFDSRAFFVEMEIGDDWPELNANLMRGNKARMVDDLRREYGEHDFDRKLADFVAFGTKPFSVVSYHNGLFEQVRRAFVMGAYYPALTSACALGERILNHLVIDLRNEFIDTPEYRRVHGKASFDRWEIPIDALVAWDVLVPAVAVAFRELKEVRNRSIHFNMATYSTLRDDAIKAIQLLKQTIEGQFGWGGGPWFIDGIVGASFIKLHWESNPFVRRYLLPGAPCVGYLHSYETLTQFGDVCVDYAEYTDYDLSDKEFTDAFNNRSPDDMAKSAPSEVVSSN